jgi:hypothetical protein
MSDFLAGYIAGAIVSAVVIYLNRRKAARTAAECIDRLRLRVETLEARCAGYLSAYNVSRARNIELSARLRVFELAEPGE